MNKKVIKVTILVIIFAVISLFLSLYITYDRVPLSWEADGPDRVIESIPELFTYDLEYDGNTFYINPYSKEPAIEFYTGGEARFLDFNITDINSENPGKLFLYAINEDGSEPSLYIKDYIEGDNLFYLDDSPEKIRLSFVSDNATKDNIRFSLNYITYDDKAEPSFNFIFCFFLIFIIILGIFLIVTNFKSISTAVNKEKGLYIMLLSFFMLYLFFSFLLPYSSEVGVYKAENPLNSRYSAGVDENMRYDVVKYILQKRSLPRGDAKELITNNYWGTSYAYSPYLSYLLAAIIETAFSLFGLKFAYLFHTARLISVISSVITLYFLYRISEKTGFKNKFLLPVLLGLWPEFVYISSYVNNDAFAVMAISVTVYGWVLGLINKWDKKAVITLTAGMALIVPSYYNAYGYLLVSVLIFIVTSSVFGKRDGDKGWFITMIKRGVLMALSVFILSGWWFIRNIYLYGDIFGNEANRAAAMKYAIPELRPDLKQSLYEQGTSLYDMLFSLEWLKNTGRSFIAAFGMLEIFLPSILNRLAILMVAAGLILFLIYFIKRAVKKEEKAALLLDINLYLSLFLSGVITFLLALIYSYFSDFQAQGRYVLPALIPLLFFVSKGYDGIKNENVKKGVSALLYALMLIMIITSVSKIFMYYYWTA